MLEFLKTFYYTTGRYAVEETTTEPATTKKRVSQRHLEKENANQSKDDKPWKLDSTTTTTEPTTRGPVAEAGRNLFTVVILLVIVGVIGSLCFLSMCASREPSGARRGVLTGLRQARSGRSKNTASLLPLFDAKEM